MAIDEKQVGLVAAQLMERLASQYGEDAKIDGVLLLVNVSHGEADSVELAASAGLARHVGIGMLEIVKHRLLTQ